MSKTVAWFLVLGAFACGAPPKTVESPVAVAQKAPVERLTLTVIGTNDLHGHIENLPVFGGYLDILRAQREKDGALVLLSGGDMFQGTLESNPNEGAAVVELYNALGYTAAAVGNHEFDFGPEGASATPEKEGDDPRGALRARAKQARFPFLAANMTLDDGEAVPWDNVKQSVLVDAGPFKVGIIGIATESTPHTTISKNVEGLRFTSIADALQEHAKDLRDRGAEVVLVAAHAGAKCHDVSNPRDLSSCKDDEIFAAADALPRGAVDVIVGGHTHHGVAHFRNGVAIVESYSRGQAFGRVDLVVTREGAAVRVEPTIHPPRNVCKKHVTECVGGEYEGVIVEPNPSMAKLVAARMKDAEEVRARSLSVKLTAPLKRSYDSESLLGNQVADWMLQARPGATAAITNGGGLRANLEAGELTYGALFEVLPFDNRFATVTMKGRDARELFLNNLQAGRGILSVAGLRVKARCKNGALVVDLRDKRGRKLKDSTPVVLATSDFLAWGGDGMIGRLGLPSDAVVIDDGPPIRDVLAAMLERRGGVVVPRKQKQRLDYPGKRPVKCD